MTITTTPHLDEWLEKNEATEDGEENEYTKNKEWWEPYVSDEDGNKHCEWICDHLGDANDKMDHLWNEILRLRKERLALKGTITNLLQEEK